MDNTRSILALANKAVNTGNVTCTHKEALQVRELLKSNGWKLTSIDANNLQKVIIRVNRKSPGIYPIIDRSN